MNKQRFETLLYQFSKVRLAVVGDIFLDRIFYIDRHWDEPSLETGLTAYQVKRRSCVPGSGGVITNNLCSLNICKCYGMAVTGDDGEAYDLRKGLRATGCDDQYMVSENGRFTPTYTKTFFEADNGDVEETHRIDLKQRSRMSAETERQVIANLHELENMVDGIICLEQVPNGEYGTFTQPVIETLRQISLRGRARVLVDSRFNLPSFHNMIVKCNDNEILRLAGIEAKLDGEFNEERAKLVEQALRSHHAKENVPVFVSCGKAGIRVLDNGVMHAVPAYRVTGPVDICGAGDSAMAGIAGALCAGATLRESAVFGNLIASICIEQLGVTGTANRKQLVARFHDYLKQRGETDV